MADAFKAAFNGSSGNRLNCACIWFPSLLFFSLLLFSRNPSILSRFCCTLRSPFHPFSFRFLLYYGSLLQNLRKYPSSRNFHSLANSIEKSKDAIIFFSASTNISIHVHHFYLGDLCKSKRSRDRSRERNYPRRKWNYFGSKTGACNVRSDTYRLYMVRVVRNDSERSLTRRIKLRRSFRKNFTWLRFVRAVVGAADAPSSREGARQFCTILPSANEGKEGSKNFI